VGAGRAAAAFLEASPQARYLGLDEGNSPASGSSVAALALLRCLYPGARVEVCPRDDGGPALRRLLRWRASFDLAHVAGAHADAACRRDLPLAADLVRPGGSLLVDGYGLYPGVRRAVVAFLAGRRHLGWEALVLPRGDLLVRRPRLTREPPRRLAAAAGLDVGGWPRVGAAGDRGDGLPCAAAGRRAA
jgi:hypothetical protein